MGGANRLQVIRIAPRAWRYPCGSATRCRASGWRRHRLLRRVGAQGQRIAVRGRAHDGDQDHVRAALERTPRDLRTGKERGLDMPRIPEHQRHMTPKERRINNEQTNHGKRLLAVFPKAKDFAPYALYAAVRSLERRAHKLAEDECNRPLSEA